MKTKLNYFILLLCSTMLITACSDDDNYTPNEVVVNAFKSKYPDATKVEWESKGIYKVVDFLNRSIETEAWFENDGKWVMTNTDMQFNELPQAIKTSFQASNYASWKVDDVDKVEQLGFSTIYIIEVEKEGNKDVDLYYEENGNLIKEVVDGHLNGKEPSVDKNGVIEQVKQKYPNAKILDLDIEKTGTEVDILDGTIHKEVKFNTNNQWIWTEWDIRVADVPEVVMNALKASDYSTYEIDDVKILEKADGISYLFELEKGDREVDITIKADGTIVNK